MATLGYNTQTLFARMRNTTPLMGSHGHPSAPRDPREMSRVAMDRVVPSEATIVSKKVAYLEHPYL